MHSISKKTLLLTIGYFALWCTGPLLLANQGDWWGLPVWFWFSCLFAPLLLIFFLILMIKSTYHD
ncbi:MAG: DUF997 family protein [Moritella sp.]|uniref:DUF997 family protein n=1 Tax=Moritella sp. TaxID=78556 RepID=UPI0025CE81DF|nr:DUF997 family protein [Moritella sp.]NQZ92896.1 DUF997 family protein [Moritella sp.]